MDLWWGIWTAFRPREGGIWTKIFQKFKCPGSCPGGMLKLRFDWYITPCSGEDTNRGQSIRSGHPQGIPCQQWRYWESRASQRKTCSRSKQIHSKKTFSSLNVIPWRESPHCLTQLVTWHYLLQIFPKSTSRRVLNTEQDEALFWKSAFTIPAKVIMQEMWMAGLEWDELYRRVDFHVSRCKSYQRLKVPDVNDLAQKQLCSHRPYTSL